MASDAEMWRSEIVSARLQMGDDALRLWGNSGTEVLLIVTRRPFWETVDEYPIPLDNSSAGGPSTSGVTIYNHDDANAGHDNWVAVAAADVVGNLPAPLRITQQNSSGAAQATRRFWQANNAFHAPASFVHVYEGEAAAYATSVAELNVNSNDSYGRVSWISDSTHASNRFTFTIPATQLAYMGGDFFRVLCRFRSAPATTMEFQLHLKFTAADPTTSFWDGPRFRSNGRYLQDMGVVQLPPGIASTLHDDIGLVLSIAESGPSQAEIDFIQLTPAHSTRLLNQPAHQIDTSTLVVNDGSVGRAYAIDGSVQWNIFDSYDSTLYVWPNRDQRLIFLNDEENNMLIARTWVVRAYYRPRRNSL